MLSGKLPDSCQSCKDAEKSEKKSYRQHVNSWFPETFSNIVSGKTDDIGPEFLDIRLGNRCNLKCRMCHPSSSFLLGKEFQEFFPDLKIQQSMTSAATLQEICKSAKNLKRITFAGGEPFLSEALEEFLDFLIQDQLSSKIDITILTNLSVFPKNLVLKLKKFNSVHISGSLDGLSDINHYIRFPSNWKHLMQNMKAFNDEGFSFSINHTVQIYNIFSVIEFLKFFEDEMKIRVDLNFLSDPLYLSIQNLPKDLKIKLHADYTARTLLQPNPQITRILDFMNLRQVSAWDMFWKWTSFLDTKRKQDVLELIPALKNWLY